MSCTLLPDEAGSAIVFDYIMYAKWSANMQYVWLRHVHKNVQLRNCVCLHYIHDKVCCSTVFFLLAVPVQRGMKEERWPL